MRGTIQMWPNSLLAGTRNQISRGTECLCEIIAGKCGFVEATAEQQIEFRCSAWLSRRPIVIWDAKLNGIPSITDRFNELISRNKHVLIASSDHGSADTKYLPMIAKTVNSYRNLFFSRSSASGWAHFQIRGINRGYMCLSSTKVFGIWMQLIKFKWAMCRLSIHHNPIANCL